MSRGIPPKVTLSSRNKNYKWEQLEIYTTRREQEKEKRKTDYKIKFQNYFLFIILLFETKTTHDNDLIEKQTNIKIYVQLTTILFLIIQVPTYLDYL